MRMLTSAHAKSTADGQKEGTADGFINVDSMEVHNRSRF